MSTGLVLTIGSFGFITLLLLSYYLQERLSSISSKLYQLMIMIIIVLIITEFICTGYFMSFGQDILFDILLHVHWATGILWFWGLYLYSVCFLTGVQADSVWQLIKTDKRSKYATIATVISLIIFAVLPFQKMTIETLNYVPGIAAYFVLAYCSTIMPLIVVLMLKRRKVISDRSKRAVYLMFIEMVIILVLQMVFPRTALWGLADSLQMYFLYFYFENPDLQMASSIEVLKQEIEKSSLAKTGFLSNMSQKIKTPVNSIANCSKEISNSSEYNYESIQKNLVQITSSGNNLLDIINNITDMPQIEAENVTLEETDYSIVNLISELSSIVERRLENSNVKFTYEIDSQIPSKLYGDSKKLFQILLNILTNAVKYTEIGKIKLFVTKDIKNNHVTLKFRIADTGIGIKKEDCDKLNELLSKSDAAAKNDLEGNNLGLVITKKYVDLLDGKIRFESEYGVGTVFYIEITQKITDEMPIGEVKQEDTETKQMNYLDCTGKKVLIVDDNLLNIKVLEKLLLEYKFTIDTTMNGKECIYKIKEGNTYDLIILDHKMPEFDGIEVLHVLKKLAESYKIPPIIVLTANAMIGAKNMYLQEGFDEYIAKPINTLELNTIINKYFVKSDS